MSNLPVPKTYKLYLGGKFPRSESGRIQSLRNANEELIANVSKASRKDFRNAVVAARAATSSWQASSAYLKGQIIYRIAEVLQGRSEQFVAELVAQGLDKKEAQEEVTASIDLLVYYAGWTDKYSAVFSTVNPVATPHFNFSRPVPQGVIVIIAPEKPSLQGLLATALPALVGGNTVVGIASEIQPLCAISFGEVLATSDVPAGVVNLLTGQRDELLETIASHRDVDAVVATGLSFEQLKSLETHAADNLKRTIHLSTEEALRSDPQHILSLQETQTTWHPIGS